MSLRVYKNLLLATVFTLSSPAFAADPIVSEEDPVPPEVVSYDWTGLHVGGGFGYGVARQTAGLELFDYSPGGLLQVGPIDLYSIGAEMDLGGDGWIGSVEAGYDVQLGNFVVGIVGDYTFSGMQTQASIFGDVCYEYPFTGTSGADDDCSTNTVSDRLTSPIPLTLAIAGR